MRYSGPAHHSSFVERHEHHSSDWYQHNGWHYDSAYWRENHHHRYYKDDEPYVILDPVAPLYFEDASRPSPYLVQPRTVYRESYSSETRLQVQVALTREGYYQGDIDGIIGAETRDSISYYQEEHQLPATGFINEPLLESLGIR